MILSISVQAAFNAAVTQRDQAGEVRHVSPPIGDCHVEFGRWSIRDGAPRERQACELPDWASLWQCSRTVTTNLMVSDFDVEDPTQK